MGKYLILALLCFFTAGCGEKPPTVDQWTAAATGNTAELNKHIAAGTNLNEKEPVGGGTPLIAAVTFGQTDTARLLLDNGAELETKNNDGSTALMCAVFFCYPETVTLLIERGADVNTTNNNGSTPLDVVASDWSPELEGIYQYIGGILQMKIDLERIKRVRSDVATILTQHGGKKSSEL